MTVTPAVLVDARLFAGGCDLSWQNNEVELTGEADEKEATTFRSNSWYECKGGLKKGSVKAGGFAAFGAAGTVDFDAWARLGQFDAWTIGPDEATAGNLAYLTSLLRAKYATVGKVGELNPWTAEGSSTWPVVRGAFLAGPGTAVTGDGSGTAVQLRAMLEGERLYGALHVVSVAGSVPTIDCIIESDSAETFDASAETRLTFTQLSACGGEILRTAAVGVGGHADDWYRITWDISSVGDESFLLAASIGIL